MYLLVVNSKPSCEKQKWTERFKSLYTVLYSVVKELNKWYSLVAFSDDSRVEWDYQTTISYVWNYKNKWVSITIYPFKLKIGTIA